MKKINIVFETKPPTNKTEQDIKIIKDKAYDILIRELKSKTAKN
ncbi:hypothetical protein [Schinkia azotoformans]